MRAYGFEACRTAGKSLEGPFSRRLANLFEDHSEVDSELAQDNRLDRKLREILRDVLGLTDDQVDGFVAETEMFGALPELDSMAVATLLTEMEDRLGFLIEDDEIDGEIFETFGGLLGFAERKLAR